MGLDVQFKAARMDVVIQEAPPCLLTLTNTGPGAVRLYAPVARLSLSVRVVDVTTGAEIIQRPRAGGFPADPLQTLDPGKGLQYDFQLDEEIRLAAPGKFDVSLIYEYLDAAGGRPSHAESAPVRFTVRPDSPRSLCLVSASGGVAAVWWGAWVNVTSDPPAVIRGQFKLLPNGRVAQVQTIALAPLQSKPVLSAAANQSVIHAHWVAWIEREGAVGAASRPTQPAVAGQRQAVLAFTHVDEQESVLSVTRVALPPGDCELVEPLHSKPLADTRIRPDGAALAWMLTAGAAAPVLQMVTFGAKPAMGPSAALPPGRPDWIMSHERSNGQRLVTFLQAVGQEARLRACPWPDQMPRAATQPPAPAGAGGPAALPPGCRDLAGWTGTFAAAGAAFDENDVLHGAAFLWMRAGNEPRLERVDWTLDSRDNFAEIGRQRVAWDFERSMDDARVRFNLEGTPAALFHENVGRWVVCMPDGDLKPVPAPYTETRHPIDLGFYGATDPPVLIVGRPLMGFDIRMLDGSPLPRRGG